MDLLRTLSHVYCAFCLCQVIDNVLGKSGGNPAFVKDLAVELFEMKAVRLQGPQLAWSQYLHDEQVEGMSQQLVLAASPHKMESDTSSVHSTLEDEDMELGVPHHIWSVLQMKVDRLCTQERTVLKLGAVIGDVFSLELLTVRTPSLCPFGVCVCVCLCAYVCVLLLVSGPVTGGQISLFVVYTHTHLCSFCFAERVSI